MVRDGLGVENNILHLIVAWMPVAFEHALADHECDGRTVNGCPAI
jgi:hypothetical protein